MQVRRVADSILEMSTATAKARFSLNVPHVIEGSAIDFAFRAVDFLSTHSICAQVRHQRFDYLSERSPSLALSAVLRRCVRVLHGVL